MTPAVADPGSDHSGGGRGLCQQGGGGRNSLKLLKVEVSHV